jgi:hypothetical protein
MSSPISDEVVPPSILGMPIRFKEASFGGTGERHSLTSDCGQMLSTFWQEVNAYLLICDETLQGDRHALRWPALTNAEAC